MIDEGLHQNNILTLSNSFCLVNQTKSIVVSWASASSVKIKPF